jgi:hypothetical protein
MRISVGIASLVRMAKTRPRHVGGVSEEVIEDLFHNSHGVWDLTPKH